MSQDKLYLDVSDVKAILLCGRNKAYDVIKSLNDELLASGSKIQAGKIPANYFFNRYKGLRKE